MEEPADAHPRKNLATAIAIVATAALVSPRILDTSIGYIIGSLIGAFIIYWMTKFSALVCFAPGRYSNWSIFMGVSWGVVMALGVTGGVVLRVIRALR